MRWNNPSQMRKGYEQVKKEPNFRVSSSKKSSCQNDQRVETTIFCKLEIFEIFKVIGPEEMPILVWGRRKRPPTKMGST